MTFVFHFALPLLLWLLALAIGEAIAGYVMGGLMRSRD